MKLFFAIFILLFFAGSIFAQNIDLNQGNIKQKTYFQKIPYQNLKGIIEIMSNYFFYIARVRTFVSENFMYNEIY
jgi:hypothetical protein